MDEPGWVGERSCSIHSVCAEASASMVFFRWPADDWWSSEPPTSTPRAELSCSLSLPARDVEHRLGRC
jgi:hypothetical protein